MASPPDPTGLVKLTRDYPMRGYVAEAEASPELAIVTRSSLYLL